MDESKYVELEAKYDACQIPVSDFTVAMAKLGGSFKQVVGLDTFFSNGSRVLRYRRARPESLVGGVDKSELTYKQRRRDGDISDRTEVNLRLAPNATEQDVRAMMEALGYEEAFTITKESWIQHVTKDPSHVIDGPVVGIYGSATAGEIAHCLPKNRIDAVFALYDVLHKGKIRRFLEVEMEPVGLNVAADLPVRLTYWKEWIARQWPQLGAPLNTSLYELYAPRNRLFVPESF